MHIGGFPNLKSAFQVEWMLKTMEKNNRKFRGPVGRIKCVMHILEFYEVWTKNYQQRIADEEYVIKICEEYLPLLGNIKNMPNIKIEKMTISSQLKTVANHPVLRDKKGLSKDDRK